MIQTKETFNEILNKFLNEVNQHPQLTEQEEIELLAKKSNETEDSKECIEKVVKANKRNIASVARLYRDSGLSASLVIHTCVLCLYEAADRYNSSMGCRYITLAYGYMHRRLQVAIRVKRQRLVDRLINCIEECEETVA